MNINEKKMIDFNNKRHLKEKELERKIDYVKQNYPKIKKILNEINELGISACLGNLSSEKYKEKETKLNNQLREELIKKGFDENFLEVKYDCNKCKDTGYINGHMCDCLKEFLHFNVKPHPLLFRKGSFEEFNENLFTNESKKGEISPRENILKNKQQSLRFINEFNDSNNNIGLLMSGKVGSGKTFLAAATGKVLLKKGYSVVCLTAREFEDAIKNFSNPSLEEDKQNILNADLLILDDLGIETQSEYVNNEILKLIEYKITYNKKMIITTNLNLNEIREKYKSRIYSRIIGSFKYLKFFGPDIRIIKKLKNK